MVFYLSTAYNFFSVHYSNCEPAPTALVITISELSFALCHLNISILFLHSYLVFLVH